MERQIIDACIRRKQPLPEKIQNAPLIRAGLEPYYVAFWELSSCRAVGMGVGPIPWTAIDRYAARDGVEDAEDFEDLVDFVRAMDDTFLKYQREQAEAEQKRNRKGGGDQSGPIRRETGRASSRG